ncbi:hypothetical protein CIPAW_03G161900 [Carya illinoinensis]|uniref:Uncharacterized protein n=1 Tax=Carya illinoinensis TaxID=32201 RepID=A0A8T1R303_CARIL|nr:hypothetical protein CIPAW_03G161900 [Carya illinoinensis]
MSLSRSHSFFWESNQKLGLSTKSDRIKVVQKLMRDMHVNILEDEIV